MEIIIDFYARYHKIKKIFIYLAQNLNDKT